MKSIELRETEDRYYADGKRITREAFQAIKNEAISRGRLECLSNARVNGVYTFYSVAVIP